MRVVVMVAFGVVVAAGASACVGAMPSGSDGTGGNGAPQSAAGDDASVGVAADLGAPADLAQPAPPDLVSADLTGLVNCFGATACDPNTTFCIRLNSGSAANPGTTKTPACYEPIDCMGANMNCDCITQDPVLGPLCANCVDHMDGTYDCYAQQ
ncbi:MAG TPA: hypothetical protein VF334_10645 [Polyangia bacterium]